jgi:poly-gamma-glutamate capsule biosynthesis protein CapA/YwtB (metallophosphatase superfamily)
MTTILIGADICPIESNQPLFARGDAQGLFNDLLPELTDADLVIANLECPLIEQASPIAKTGPIFGAPNDCINGIKAAGIDVLCLANNHIMDHGEAGLKNTLEVCAAAGIATVGAGKSLTEARRILIRQVGNIRVGILGVAEHEFSIAANGTGGAAPLDAIDFVRNVTSQRKNLDYLIVLVHGSAEFHVPTPRIQDVCRFMVEMGANAVIVQHPHVLGGCEEYRGGHIVYGQGALIMDEAIYRDLKSFHEGFLVKLKIAEDATSTMEFVPFTQSDPLPGAHKMTDERAGQFRKLLRSMAVQDPSYVQEQWRRYCEERKYSYLSSLLGHNRILGKLNRRGLLTKWFYGKKSFLGVRNVVCCETHREALETIFNHRVG